MTFKVSCSLTTLRWSVFAFASTVRTASSGVIPTMTNVRTTHFALLLRRWPQPTECRAKSAQSDLGWSPVKFCAQLCWLNFKPGSSCTKWDKVGSTLSLSHGDGNKITWFTVIMVCCTTDRYSICSGPMCTNMLILVMLNIREWKRI